MAKASKPKKPKAEETKPGEAKTIHSTDGKTIPCEKGSK